MSGAPSKVIIERTIAALEARGHTIAGARLLTDGSIEVLTTEGARPLALPEPVSGSWVDLTGEAEAGHA